MNDMPTITAVLHSNYSRHHIVVSSGTAKQAQSKSTKNANALRKRGMIRDNGCYGVGGWKSQKKRHLSVLRKFIISPLAVSSTKHVMQVGWCRKRWNLQFHCNSQSFQLLFWPAYQKNKPQCLLLFGTHGKIAVILPKCTFRQYLLWFCKCRM